MIYYIVFFCFACILIVLSYVYWDIPISIICRQYRLREDYPIISWITWLGNGTIAIPLVLLGLWFHAAVRRIMLVERIWFILSCAGVSSFICFILKISLSRARPKLFFNMGEYGFFWFKLSGRYWSFPSGHTSLAVSIAYGCCVLFPRYKLVFVTLAVCVASSRVLLCHHYISDILSAGYLTLVETMLLTYFLRNNGLFARVLGTGQNKRDDLRHG